METRLENRLFLRKLYQYEEQYVLPSKVDQSKEGCLQQLGYDQGSFHANQGNPEIEFNICCFLKTLGIIIYLGNAIVPSLSAYILTSDASKVLKYSKKPSSTLEGRVLFK